MPSTSADSDDSRSKRDRSPLLRRVALHALWVAAVLLVALGVAGGIYVDRLAQRTPDVTDLRQAQSARPSLIVAADGRLLASFSRAQHVHVPLDRIAPVVVQALIATEDERFHAHRGIDWRRTASAAVHTLFGDTQGGSTLTQQLARNLFPEEIGRARTLERKLKEMIVARRLERVFDKRQILAAYLNTAPFLYNVVGIEMAARTYYGKHAAALGAPEAAMLVGMLKGTYHYNPVIHPERALARRNVVLAQMARAGVLAPAQAEALAAQPLALSFRRPSESPGLAPHFTAQVRRLALAWAEANDRDLHADGLVIHTPLDMRLQEAATEAVRTQTAALQQVADVEWSARRLPVSSTSIARYAKAHAQVQPFAWFWESRPELLADFVRETPAYRRAVDDGAGPDKALATLMHDDAALAALRSDKTRLEAGFVALDPASGEVRAWVGSRDFVTDQFDHVAQAARQPGSTFKPFVYGAALEAGMSPDYGYLDRPVEIALADGSVWRPSDMGEPSLEPMTLAEALVHSRNTVTAQLMLDIGVPRVAAFARAAGVDRSPLDAVPSLALGTSPVTLLEMVNGYAAIASQGVQHAPLLMLRITDRHGRVLADFAPDPRRAMREDTAAALTDMLRGVVQRGTGTALRTRFGIRADVAGKTGTSQDNMDGWFILMHPHLVAGAWVGFNDQRVRMRSSRWGQGGYNALRLVGDFYRTAFEQGWLDASATFDAPRHVPPEHPVNIEALWDEQFELQFGHGVDALLRAHPAGAGTPLPIEHEAYTGMRDPQPALDALARRGPRD